MKKISERQKRRLQEIKERNEILDKEIIGKIHDTVQALPLNLILEARFNVISRKAIQVEAEIAFLEEDENREAVKPQLEVLKRRLDHIRGQLNELQNVGDMLAKYDHLGRRFEIVPNLR